MPTRKVVLSDSQEDLIKDLVESGRYQSASEVIRAGLRLIEDHEGSLRDVRRDLVEGLRQSAAGETIDGEAAIQQAFERALVKGKQ